MYKIIEKYMKKNTAKNYVSKIAATMFCLVMLVYGHCGYAGKIQIPVEIQCSNSPLTSPWVIFNGEPGSQHTLITNGLREEGREGILEVVEIEGIGRTCYGLHVCVEARCILSNNRANLSLTGSYFTCEVGEGMRVTMFAPNSSNPDKYHYVGTLITSRDEEKMQKVTKKMQEVTSSTNNIASNVEKEQLWLNAKIIFPEFGASF
jgi:hypothetical protein